MKTIFSLVILVAFACSNISAQYYTNQNKKWTFGAYAGLDFTSGVPTPFSTSLQTQEGSASVADASGNLLFYTDGKTIWDKTGNMMPSGSSIVPYITNSTTQGAVIVPTLNNANQYYVFSLEQAQSTPTTTSHLAYSIVDMTLNSGLGDVVTPSGTLMDSFLSEKMIAIPGNNCNIWLLVHKLNAPVFRAYEITAAGINFTPVVSTSGSLSGIVRGVIKVSPNRQKIASANSTANAELYDFNPNTGVVSNSNLLNIANCYGAEFSPDNTKLYLSNNSSPVGVFQYDITLPTISSIVASQYTVTTATSCYDLKLASDNKIYIASYSSGSLDCISAPNLSGSACNLTHAAASLAPGTCYLGFPNLVWSVSPPVRITGDTILCQGTSTTLSDASPGGTWTSSNTIVATVNGATGYVTTGNTGVSIITYTTSCGAVSTTVTVNANPATISGTTTICNNSTTTLSDATAGGTWSSSNTDVSISSAGSSGNVVVTGTATGISIITYSLPGGCVVTTTVTVHSSPSLITGTTTICAGSTTQLSDAVSGGTWSSTTPSVATISATGLVTGVAAGIDIISYSTGSGCTVTTTITVTSSTGAGTITGPTSVCSGSTITLSDAVSGGIWSSSNSSATVSGGLVTGVFPGVDTISYTVNSPSCGTAVATWIVTVTLSPDAGTITGGTDICYGSALTLSDAVAGGIWSSSTTAATVSGGIVSPVVIGTAIISYSVTNACGTAVDTQAITVYPLPPITPITGQNTVCQNITFALSDATPGGTWSSSNEVIASIDNNGNVSVFTQGVDTASTVTISYTTGPSANGCYSTVTFVLNISAHGTFNIDSTIIPVKCYGGNDGSIDIVINGGTQLVQYLWGNGVDGGYLTGQPAGFDTLYIKDEVTQCSDVLTFYIPGPAAPLKVAIVATSDTCFEGKGSINAAATGGTMPYNYLWSNNKTDKEITGLLAGPYSVTITDSNGCIQNLAGTVNEDTCSGIVIHDVLTPNGDGFNDTWVIENIQGYPASNVQIYDKWGDMVYEKTNYQNDWAGKGKSGPLPDGTYYYLVKLNVSNPNGGTNTWTGSLLIKR